VFLGKLVEGSSGAVFLKPFVVYAASMEYREIPLQIKRCNDTFIA
jgi:hypothetical protein